MLQQTQVPRVVEKYREFLRAFPTVHVLAHARLAEVLRVWSGLGYNRRGKYLHEAAQVIDEEYRGDIKAATASKKLLGVGPYTRAAVRVFAYNEPHVLLETNVRAAFIHHFFAPLYSHDREDWVVSDKDVMRIAQQAAKGQDPREWHWALMDYGAYIKKAYKNPARKSKSYVRQSKFEGSTRQVRGAVLRALHEGRSLKELPYERKRMNTALASLQKDGLVAKQSKGWRIA